MLIYVKSILVCSLPNGFISNFVNIKQFIMTKNKKFLFILPLAIVALASFTYIFQSDKETAIDQALMQNLKMLHYAPLEINDVVSEKVYNLYIKRLDGGKKFLIEPDIDELKKMNHSIDDDINKGEFNFFDKSLEIINNRIEEAKTYYTDVLSKPFDFTKDETVETDGEKLKFSKSKEDLKEAWRKSMKYNVLAKISEMMEAQNKAKEKSDTVKIKSEQVLEADARKKVLKTYDDYFKRLKKFNRNDRLSMYFNVITSIYDPHTEYFAPKDKAAFDAGMSGQFYGIGAQLQEKDDYIKVTNIIAGTPSYRQGQLKVGDFILKVAQGADEPVEVVDMPLEDVVQLIRGKKGTEVRLTVKKPDGSIVVIPIIRDIVVMEDTFAQSLLLKGKKNIGYIKLPEFYDDFNGTGGRSCSRDVKKELEKLKEEKVDGVILDLRNNGGGSLNDVIEMAGLFIDKGPVVQIKTRAGAADIKEDPDPSITYSGPLSIMVNSNSASASEIMAAAIQDYRRGVIVGTSPTTFGKGTVQRVYELDPSLPASMSNLKPLGAVKVTMQKFYRINGGATQLKGVTPDIILPDPYYLLDLGEKEMDYPLAWDEIASAKYKELKPDYSVEKLRANSTARMKSNPSFGVLEEAAKRVKKQKDSSVVSLNFDKYIAEQKRFKAESKKMENLDKEIGGVEVIGLKADAFPASDTLKVKKTNDFYKAIKKDIYLNETINIMNDMK